MKFQKGPKELKTKKMVLVVQLSVINLYEHNTRNVVVLTNMTFNENRIMKEQILLGDKNFFNELFVPNMEEKPLEGPIIDVSEERLSSVQPLERSDNFSLVGKDDTDKVIKPSKIIKRICDLKQCMSI